MIKWLGCLLIFGATIYANVTYEKSKKEVLFRLKIWIDFMEYYQMQVDFFQVSFAVALKEYESKNQSLLLKIPYEVSCFSTEINHEINDFLNHVGQGYQEEQLKRCSYLSRILSDAYETDKKEYKNQIKIFRAISFFIGCSLIILIV